MTDFTRLCRALVVAAALTAASLTIADAPKVAIAIHGGAGSLTKVRKDQALEAEYRRKLAEVVTAGYEALRAGKSSVEAVATSIRLLESSPLFNAGVGAVLTFEGTHELDAAIMDGLTREAGAVAGVTTVEHPIDAALAVMRSSDHVLLSGPGADRFAQAQGLSVVTNDFFTTARRLDALRRARGKIDKLGTVGAVALDQSGNLAAGTSTGGRTAKRYGRIGDSPIIGAGTYAHNDSCAVSATGEGEYFIRLTVASDLCARVRYLGMDLTQSAQTIIHGDLSRAGGRGGVIAIDQSGNIAAAYNTKGMYRASIDSEGRIDVSIFEAREMNGNVASQRKGSNDNRTRPLRVSRERFRVPVSQGQRQRPH